VTLNTLLAHGSFVCNVEFFLVFEKRYVFLVTSFNLFMCRVINIFHLMGQ
jgi:hypothetical protein